MSDASFDYPPPTPQGKVPTVCGGCQKDLGDALGSRYVGEDDWFIAEAANAVAPCYLCEDCLVEARGNMTDTERDFFKMDD